MNDSTLGKLSKGLSSLMGEQKTGSEQDNFVKIEPDQLVPSPYQPRTEFDQESLQELADSISKNGIIQPIVARQRGKNKYEIIAGERRWRAAKMLKLATIPVILRNLTDRDCMEIALVENIQRRDLSPLEEAQAYRRLLGEFGYTQEGLARAVGKSRSHVANILRLLTLPDSIKDILKTNAISMGHARAILSAENPDYVAQKIIEQKLSVRETEELIQDIQSAKEQKSEQPQIMETEIAIPAQEPGNVDEIIATAPTQQDEAVSAENPVMSEEANRLMDKAQAIGEAQQAIERAVKNLGINADELEDVYTAPRFKDPDIIALEERLTMQLGCKVQIKSRGKRGELRIKYKNLEQLDGLIQLIDNEKSESVAA